MKIAVLLLFSLFLIQPAESQVAPKTPNAPGFLRCGDGQEGYGLYWIDQSIDETQFNVYLAVNSVENMAVHKKVKSNTSATAGTEYFLSIDSLSANFYTYAVTALNKNGESMSSNVTILPKRPVDFTGESDTMSITLKWKYPADSWITMVFVERSTRADGGFEIMSPVVSLNGIVFVDYSIERNIDYYYRIRGAFFDSRSRATSYTSPSHTVGPFRVGGMVKEYDGEFTFQDRAYKYRKFGKLTWMTENLAYLPEVYMPDSVSQIQKRYYVHGYSGTDASKARESENFRKYGALYNWAAASDGTVINPEDSIGVQGICPDGWHLPSNKEWLGLRSGLGMAKASRDSAFRADAIRKNMAAGSMQPAVVDFALPDFHEYQALKGGYLDGDSSRFIGLGEVENYWSSTGRIQAERDYQSAEANKGSAFSVRCIKGAALPTVHTGEIAGITEKAAQPAGSITNDGGDPVIERGVLWSTLESNDLVFNRTVCGNGSGDFSCTLTGLAKGTIYFVRAFASNSVGTAYGELKQFTTAGEGALPTVITGVASEVLANTAAIGGKFTTYGGSAITARGICWGTAKKPTISDNKAVSVSGLATFTGYIAGLQPKTTYYARAYATNGQGTAYGPEIQFTTIDQPQDGFFEAAGRKYAFVNIGAQTWMAENLAYLPAVSPLAEESRDKPVYYVYGYNGRDVDSAKANPNYQTYGVLYNWAAATTACPKGWHLPTHEEIVTLTSYLTNYGYAYGGAGKTIAKSVASPQGWEPFPLPGTVGQVPELNNRTGFNTLPAGQRIIAPTDQANGMGRVGIFWSSSSYGREDKYAYSLAVIYSNNLLQPYPTDKRHGFSIRCLRD